MHIAMESGRNEKDSDGRSDTRCGYEFPEMILLQPHLCV